ncbi:type IV toxin-antitoxin system AbiEi family antitoxin domain-containing protein [Nostocoides sp. HKS02]|uniref:type IV toxin-antitoxin system AbiEi family antitoxin domain-containing protein n=1 Tax=Nostocoides sp. HKS02 TaxID=1813880 RepID=UPI0012B441E4|nr:type IV toxin-antitoxin system AbiEi family antitoxin domain-containing protein [Tetrasphaera sp. HKS02]QGN57754.1 hypothetical protein GKE56_07555 [Tetrasphaera sp. HKS02]
MAVDWTALRRLADHQSGMLTRAQCLEAGVPLAMLRWRVDSGRWVRVHEGVFLTVPGRDDWRTAATAALLRALSGSPAADAALCGDSAAYLWGLRPHPPRTIELVVPQRRSVARPSGATVRRSMRWDDLVHDRAFPWRTTAAATVLDVATRGSRLDALSLVARAVQRELTTVSELWAELVARGGHRHSALLRTALAEIDEGGESGAELLFVRDVERAHGLPRSLRQEASDLGRRRYHDFDYAEYGLLVEVDGRLGHEQWRDRVRDGQRDRQQLTRARVTTRVFWPDVAVTPCDTAGELGSILGSRGWPGRPRPCRRAGCSLRR